MASKEKEQQRSKKSIAAEVIYSEKSPKILAYIQEIKERLTNIKGKETNPSELLNKID
jgi:primosomal protein N''